MITGYQARTTKLWCDTPIPKKKPINVVGKIKGTISNKILGKNGFGYDPIFIPKNYNKTFGEMPKSKKIKIDHRYLAFKMLKKKVKIL